MAVNTRDADIVLGARELELALGRGIIASDSPEMRRLNTQLDHERENAVTRASRYPCENVIDIDSSNKYEIRLSIDPKKALEFQLDPETLQQELGSALERLQIRVREHREKYPRPRAYFIASPDELLKTVRTSQDPVITRERDDIIARHRLIDRLYDNGHTTDSVVWATRYAHNRTDIKDTYFKTENLAHPRLVRGMPPEMGKHKALMTKVADYLQREKGIVRLSYLASGIASIVFETIPDDKGRQQLVILTPMNSHEEYIPHPGILPDKSCHLIQEGDLGISVRISPALLRGENVTVEDVQNAYKMYDQSGLVCADLKTPEGEWKTTNTLKFINSEGEAILFCNDRGAVRWPEGITEDGKRELIKTWEDDRSLDKNRVAIQELMGDGNVQNAWNAEQVRQITRQNLPESEPSPVTDNVIARGYKKGMYPREISEASHHALESAEHDDNPGEKWRNFLKNSIDRFDPSSRPR